MKFITVAGTAGKRRLSEYLNENIRHAWLLAPDGEEGAPVDTFEESEVNAALSGRPGMIPEDSVIIIEANVTFEGVTQELALVYLELPLEGLSEAEAAATPYAELALVDWGPGFSGLSEIEVERALKAAGLRKVIIFIDDSGREWAFRKSLDIARSRLGGEHMPEDVPQSVLDALRAAAPDGRIECERAHDLAGELGVEPETVGRALDLLSIKITRCRLGCF